jgi:hypothetical protein
MMKTSGKYLGNISQTNGKTNLNVDNRINAMRDSYYALQKFWTRRDVKLRTKGTAFKGMVLSAGLSGMEAETATKSELKKLDIETMRLARKVMAGRACMTDLNDSKKALKNEWVRKKLGIYTTESELSKRRVKWYKKMLIYPEENKLLRAALTGKLEMDEHEYTGFTPWIELIMDDVSTLSETLKVVNVVEQKLREEISITDHHPNGEFMWKLLEILEWDEDKLRRFECKNKQIHEEQRRPEAQTLDEHKCDICEYTGNKQQVAMHMAKTHNKRRKLINYVPGNYCPLCQTIFSNQQTAVQHLERLEVRYNKDNEQTGCKTKNMNKGEPYKKTKLACYECNECNKTYKLDDIDSHLKAHIEHVIFQKTMDTQGGAPMGVLGMLMQNNSQT